MNEMRLWHTKLIKALPNMHLQAQWRELSAIAGGYSKEWNSKSCFGKLCIRL